MSQVSDKTRIFLIFDLVQIFTSSFGRRLLTSKQIIPDLDLRSLGEAGHLISTKEEATTGDELVVAVGDVGWCS